MKLYHLIDYLNSFAFQFFETGILLIKHGNVAFPCGILYVSEPAKEEIRMFPLEWFQRPICRRHSPIFLNPSLIVNQKRVE